MLGSDEPTFGKLCRKAGINCEAHLPGVLRWIPLRRRGSLSAELYTASEPASCGSNDQVCEWLVQEGHVRYVLEPSVKTQEVVDVASKITFKADRRGRDPFDSFGCGYAFGAGRPDNSRQNAVVQNAIRKVQQGEQIFRFDTFGDQAFWGDTLKLHQAIEGAKLGGVGPGVVQKRRWRLG